MVPPGRDLGYLPVKLFSGDELHPGSTGHRRQPEDLGDSPRHMPMSDTFSKVEQRHSYSQPSRAREARIDSSEL